MNLQAGTVLGPYRLLVPIAEGDVAEVWAAIPTAGTQLSDVVALKALWPSAAEENAAVVRQMFMDEANLAMRIRHPNVARVLEVGEAGDWLYLAMEWVDGEPLSHLMQQASARGVPYDLSARIVSQACSGLHAAHRTAGSDGRSLGIVHRNVSPQNLIISYDGVVKLVDFGIARATSNIRSTAVGEVKGKADYMAPEQAQMADFDARADVFALGIILYELLTGRHPFRGDDDASTLKSICSPTPPVPPVDLLEDFPDPLSDVVVRALEKDAKHRFPTMEEMGAALDHAAMRLALGTIDLGRFVSMHLAATGEQRRASILASLPAEGRSSARDSAPTLVEEAPSLLAEQEPARQRRPDIRPPADSAPTLIAPAPMVEHQQATERQAARVGRDDDRVGPPPPRGMPAPVRTPRAFPAPPPTPHPDPAGPARDPFAVPPAPKPRPPETDPFAIPPPVAAPPVAATPASAPASPPNAPAAAAPRAAAPVKATPKPTAKKPAPSAATLAQEAELAALAAGGSPKSNRSTIIALVAGIIVVGAIVAFIAAAPDTGAPEPLPDTPAAP